MTTTSSSRHLTESERRVGLRRLDDVLQATEELNLREGGEIPTRLKEKLLREGMPVRGNSIYRAHRRGPWPPGSIHSQGAPSRPPPPPHSPLDAQLVSAISSRYRR